ncbi:MAG: I78 family peptidase inhibitor [Parasphingopyxis sp.]|uniref:I78 family peptidase inhibitor n=1 Tax=Parasphingopyxis sp. TaxID=1920299 RepID=UPI003FA0CCB5
MLKSMKGPSSLIASSVLIAACQAIPPSDNPRLDAVSCPADGYQSLVGAQLAAVTLPAGLVMRVINPGDAVTQDYRPDRMNVDLDERGVITRVYCG